MNSHLRPLFAAAVLATTLYTPSALAALIVSGGAVTTVNPILRVLDDGTTAEVTLSAIETWDFKLIWGAAPLTLNKANSKFTIGTTTYNGFSDLFTNFFGGANYVESSGVGEYTFSWADYINFDTLDLANGFEFVAAFDINPGATAGIYDITFGPTGLGSALTSDSGAMEFKYSTVTSGQDPMRVFVPEPGVLALLLGGFGVLGAARLRRKAS